MRKILLFSFVLIFIITAGIFFKRSANFANYGAPPYVGDEANVPKGLEDYPGILDWERPEGPLRVGLQAGHWKNDELPDELERIRESGGGTSGWGVLEWEVNLEIAQKAKEILEMEGIAVDILPSTIPPGYYADVFVAIHADGSLDPRMTGYKSAHPRRDFTGKAEELLVTVEDVYGEVTGLAKDPNVSRNMRGYYAFSWWRFDHAIHPMTPALILETGFLTNRQDANMLIDSPEIPAQALADALTIFLKGDEK